MRTMSTKTKPTVYTLREAARLLGVSTSLAYQLARQGRPLLPGADWIKVQGRGNQVIWRGRAAAIDRALQGEAS